MNGRCDRTFEVERGGKGMCVGIGSFSCMRACERLSNLDLRQLHERANLSKDSL